MPAQSEKQLRYIYYLRNKYGSKEKAPQKYKWAFKKEWGTLNEVEYIENVFDLLKKNKKNDWIGNLPAVRKFLQKNFSHLEQLPDIYGGIEKYINKGTVGIVFKIKGKDLALKIEIGNSPRDYDTLTKIKDAQDKGGAVNYKRIYYIEHKIIKKENQYSKMFERETPILITIFELCKPFNFKILENEFLNFVSFLRNSDYLSKNNALNYTYLGSFYVLTDTILQTDLEYHQNNTKHIKILEKYFNMYVKQQGPDQNKAYFKQLFDIGWQNNKMGVDFVDFHAGNVMLSLDGKLLKLVDF